MVKEAGGSQAFVYHCNRSLKYGHISQLLNPSLELALAQFEGKRAGTLGPLEFINVHACLDTFHLQLFLLRTIH